MRAKCHASGGVAVYHVAMAEFDDSSLWRISAFERQRATSPASGATTLLPTTLLSDLRRLRPRGEGGEDVLEVVAACQRHRESALLYLGCGPLVWPVTLFPARAVYHSPRAVSDPVPAAALGRLHLIGVEPPGVRPPGDFRHERVAGAERYHPLPDLLWALALQGPRQALLAAIPGDARYRLAAGLDAAGLPRGGAVGPALARLRAGSASLRDMSAWPGMSLERASRMLNGLYLTGGLIVLRHPDAGRREASSLWWPWLSRRR
jgi:hypothetical protein